MLFIRSFIYSEINTFELPKFSKISFAFNIFVPIPVQEMVYLKTIQKITPVDVSLSRTIDQKTYLKKFRGGFSPLSPPIGSAYGLLESLRQKLTSRVALLRRLAGSDWGAGGTTLRTTTLALAHSTAVYCTPVS